MSYDAGIRIFCPQIFQQRPERSLLHLCSGVSRTPFLIQSSLIDYAEGAVIVIACMNATDSFWKQWYYVTIATNIIMVGALSELLLATGNERFCTEGYVAPVSNAVDHQQAHRRM
jgi:hypothetical protein